MALRSTGKCPTVPAMPMKLGPSSVSTLKILVLSSKRCASRVSPKVTRVSAAIAICPAFFTTTTVVIELLILLEKHAAEVRQDLSQISVEARRRRSIDDPVIPGERHRQHQPRLELLAVPDRLRLAAANAKDSDFRGIDDRGEVPTSDTAERRNRESRARHLRRAEFAFACLLRELGLIFCGGTLLLRRRRLV